MGKEQFDKAHDGMIVAVEWGVTLHDNHCVTALKILDLFSQCTIVL